MGGIGIVRLSGAGAVGVLYTIFTPKDASVAGKYKSHRIYYGKVVNCNSGEVVDEALASVMRAPRTYTREDVVEINCHGGPAAVKRVLELCVHAGARLAEPGEFTRRAYENGRIDLTQAEAVMDIISSTTELSLAAAVGQLGGGLKQRVEAIREKIAGLLALIEVSIDFPEEEIDYVPAEGLLAAGREASEMVGRLLATYEEGRVLREGLRVAIVGSPNVGKSSLLNRLARMERAIVTDIPGTTRDTVEEVVNIGGVPVRVIDTAGIRHSEDTVEREGIRRSEEALKQADLVLLVLDGSKALSDDDLAMLEKVNEYRHILLLNKSDLPNEPFICAGGIPCMGSPIKISAKTGEGIEELTVRLRESVLGGGSEKPPEAMVNLRHKLALERAAAGLTRFEAGIAEGVSPEFLALEVREALDAVGGIIGETTPDDVLNIIFNKFCIGK
jgi:tRNA modification GTPase